MGRVLAGMSMSVDGYVEDASGSARALGAGWDPQSPAYLEVLERTGAVVMGRGMFDAAGDPDSYAADYEFQVPLFVVTSSPPEVHPVENERLTVTFVTDGPLAAVTQAIAAAGDRDVCVVGGSGLITALLRAGAVDVLELDVVPVLLGGGKRMFDDPALAGVQLAGPRATLRWSPGTGPSL